ncbi:hypothetical protein OG618_08190 [Kitasatospora sp. NBC_01246]|uniref:hypothetical protein n=1 Tax=Kitasatospora sp. NBC_01246 TaxID=2903570 RepID=UPI002E350616|nr:hypothetical protein [Kitasatospora sp. NBC_01246]
MATQIAHGHFWEEEHVTHELCEQMFPEVRYVKFNRPQETRIGADYLWWWSDPDGQSFGCLIQAKSLKKRANSWRVGSDDPSKLDKQLTRLLAAADQLQVPAAVSLYAGDAAYRHDLVCSFGHQDAPCNRREGAAVTLLPALPVLHDNRHQVGRSLMARLPVGGVDGADVFHQALPLVRLTDPGPDPQTITYTDLDLQGIRRDLRPFLVEDQTGARKVAKMLYDAMRCYQTSDSMPKDRLAYMSPWQLPSRLDFTRSTSIRHIHRGLRSELPDYVEPALAGAVPSSVAQYAAGLVLVQL